MAGLARGEENQIDKVNWFLFIGDNLTDGYEVSFRIFDITAGLPGAQVFPETIGEYEDVTNAPGRFGVGAYYAYDNAAGAGYTPPLTANIGTHRIEWRWKSAEEDPYRSGYEDFEVLIQSEEIPTDTYCTLADLRYAGLPDPPFSDAEIWSQIEIWQSFLDRACRQWFNPRELTIEFDGNDSDTIHFGVPIISIEYLRINENPTDLDTTYYKVYSDRNFLIDRQNPRIKLIPNQRRDIFTAPSANRGLVFRKGRKNQIVKGIFGYTEADGSTPKLIKRALIKLVIEKLMAPVYSPPGSAPPGGTVPPILGGIIEEWTDGHKTKYQAPGGDTKPVAPGLKGITSDTEILQIIKMYKGPLGIATPSNFSYR
jgi:hypothetical protein